MKLNLIVLLALVVLCKQNELEKGFQNMFGSVPTGYQVTGAVVNRGGSASQSSGSGQNVQVSEKETSASGSGWANLNSQGNITAQGYQESGVNSISSSASAAEHQRSSQSSSYKSKTYYGAQGQQTKGYYSNKSRRSHKSYVEADGVPVQDNQSQSSEYQSKVVKGSSGQESGVVQGSTSGSASGSVYYESESGKNSKKYKQKKRSYKNYERGSQYSNSAEESGNQTVDNGDGTSASLSYQAKAQQSQKDSVKGDISISEKVTNTATIKKKTFSKLNKKLIAHYIYKYTPCNIICKRKVLKVIQELEYKVEYYKKKYNACKHKVIVRVKKVKYLKKKIPYWIKFKLVIVNTYKKPIYEKVLQVRYRKKKIYKRRARVIEYYEVEPEIINEIVPVVTWETKRHYKWIYLTKEKKIQLNQYSWIITRKRDWISARVFYKSPQKVYQVIDDEYNKKTQAVQKFVAQAQSEALYYSKRSTLFYQQYEELMKLAYKTKEKSDLAKATAAYESFQEYRKLALEKLEQVKYLQEKVRQYYATACKHFDQQYKKNLDVNIESANAYAKLANYYIIKYKAVVQIQTKKLKTLKAKVKHVLLSEFVKPSKCCDVSKWYAQKQE